MRKRKELQLSQYISERFTFSGIVLATCWWDSVTLLCPYLEAAVETWKRFWKNVLVETLDSNTKFPEILAKWTTLLKNKLFHLYFKKLCLFFRSTGFKEHFSVTGFHYSYGGIH